MSAGRSPGRLLLLAALAALASAFALQPPPPLQPVQQQPRPGSSRWGLTPPAAPSDVGRWLLRCRGGAKNNDDELRRQIEREDQDIASVFQAEEEDAGAGDEPSPQWTVPEEEGSEEEEGDDSGATTGAGGLPLEERTACIVIDPFSHFLGKRLKREALAKGLATVDVLCPYTSVNLGPGTRRWRPPSPGHEAEWAAEMPFQKIAFVLSESDVGTATAERLQVALGVRGNGVNPARRNKYLTNLALKARGAASTRQLLTGDWAEAESFLAQLQQECQQQQQDSAGDDEATPPPFAVVKPARGAASGDVYVCRSVAEARQAFEAILHAPTYGGGFNDAVLLQEYLRGQEWAVDTVSRDGETKVVAVWRYDKRAANGAPCVYFGTMLEAAPEGSEARAVADYVVEEVLPALGVKWGPTHTEVIMAPAAGREGARGGKDGATATTTTPVVVECNCRWHLCNFVPVTDACLGANAVDATLAAFVDPEAWAKLPAMPEKLKAHGRVVHLVCFGAGRVAGHRHLAAIEALESVREVEVYAGFDVGEVVAPTVDIRTDAGYVLLVHEDPAVVERDYRTIAALQPEIIHVEPVKR